MAEMAGLGGAALLSTLAARWVKDRLPQSRVAPAIAAFLALAVYEGSLFAISLAVASGVSDYAPSIVWRIFAINTAAFAALFLGHRLGLFAGLAKESRLPARERSA
ncbi:MAG: hypothetical protein DLM68_14555 [Hyphomicrobiales bacterium]|nr:MAG: hypothetical protein DLM68_14555 [Hyphomicrobiales bacterium]